MNNKVKQFINENYEEMTELLRSLCTLPAPSGREEKRAHFCCEWLKANGADGVYIDEAKNVVFEFECDNRTDLTVISAHTDTVFSDLEPMPLKEDEKNIYCPGVGDNTASVCVLMTVIRFFVQNAAACPKGILFVLNSCEEGLGNLKGTKCIFDRYGKRVERFIAFDATSDKLFNRCVGSHRYRVEALTEGGHSFYQFGKKNAISVLSEIISKIYEIQVPQKENSTTTYNVGIISGGTSVNTIAQNAVMLCEYRSDDTDCLEIMKEKFEQIFSSVKAGDVKINVALIGTRPCAKGVDAGKQAALSQMCAKTVEAAVKKPVVFGSSSTDCNIPLSQGIPAVCVGVYRGGGEHTREEWIEKESLRAGLETALKIALEKNNE